MKHYVISLARTPERLERFRRVNSHLPDITHAPGIDGQQVDRQNIIKAGMLTADCQFTAGAVGSGLTHIALWGAIAQSQEPAHIFEDDAFLCQNFASKSQEIIQNLPEDWEIILWGQNSDAPLHYEVLPGQTDCFAQFNQDDVRRGIEGFRFQQVETLPFRLKQTFGICGYALSPLGAVSLMKRCLPMASLPINYPSLGNRTLISSSIDHLMNRHYAEMKAYCCVPPLVLTDNLTAQSLNRA
ncbi:MULTISPECIES: glycosyltransferase family 25 protein [Bombella]|uniref:Glycosyltransferase family 25 protein n=1 Tax=Bombella pollinis TaxID=2967337 RepID=A0ABT3WQI0_9PROT|nr:MULTISPECIES: glycosyltransferase family 25 protein [Bombella]MCX5619967.1 glycosyltransferase family 25 protein [Bombella pollinis]MUG05158.1 glycosyl transferase [Bombella sp. ESL0378]MUG90705.1 glycosyl transferase [Bombella sp. ESL0385]